MATRIKAKTHYKYIQKNKERVKVAMTSREVKAFIMRINGWTAEEYQKNYDIFKNKLRAYEAVEAQGGNVKKQSVVDVLYAEAKSKELYGADYKPSEKMKRIRATSAYSITKGRKKAQEQAYLEKERKKYEGYIKKDYGGLIDWANNPKNDSVIAAQVRKLIEEGQDPIKVHAGLSALATEFERLRRDQGKYIGDYIGSDKSDMYFDVSPYLL